MSTLTQTMETILTGGSDKVILSNTDEVTVFVCNGVSLPLLMSFAARVSTDLGLSLKEPEKIKDNLLGKADDVGFLLKLISNYTEDVYTLMGAMSSLKTAEAVKNLPVDDILKVLISIVAVNQDFFTKRVLPVLQGGR